MASGLWKKNHPGVPLSWRRIGEGGNAVVWDADGVAVKRLKPTANREARDRFERECRLMDCFRGKGFKIVPTIEVRHREGADEIVMEVMSGNLEEMINRFRWQPAKAAAALVPVVDTLAELAEAEPRIHHRDLKPTNLLYRKDEADLNLGDFGCAFLSDGERITPDRRALGAWAFRPPEYSGGRVEEVDERGDVFSMGKVLWSMVNGEPNVTFPGPLWFLPEYDLTLICGGVDGVAEAMYVVAKCCSIRADARPTLREFSAMLTGLSNGSPKIATGLGAEALTKEQQQEIEYAQRRAIARPFLLKVVDDLEQTLVLLHGASPESLLLEAWLTEWRRLPARREGLLEQVVEHESDAPVMNVHRRQRMLNTRFFPEGMNGPLRFVASYGRVNEEHLSPRLTIEALDGGLVAVIERLADEPERTQYTTATLPDFLRRAIDVS